MTNRMIARWLFLVGVLAGGILALSVCGCAGVRIRDGGFAFPAAAATDEVDAVARRVDGTEAALAAERGEREAADETIRSDVRAADDAAAAAFTAALAEGKTAAEAMGAASAAAAARAQADAARALEAAAVKSAAAAAGATDRREAQAAAVETSRGGTLGIAEILALLGLTAAGGGIGHAANAGARRRAAAAGPKSA